MKQLLLVFLGGGLGSCFRFLISRYLNPLFPNFFWGTFLVNVVGCLLIGLFLGLSLRQNVLNQHQALFLSAGFCGGFTTFSAFALESHNLIKNGDYAHLFLYIGASIMLGILAVLLGFWLVRNA